MFFQVVLVAVGLPERRAHAAWDSQFQALAAPLAADAQRLLHVLHSVAGRDLLVARSAESFPELIRRRLFSDCLAVPEGHRGTEIIRVVVLVCAPHHEFEGWIELRFYFALWECDAKGEHVLAACATVNPLERDGLVLGAPLVGAGVVWTVTAGNELGDAVLVELPLYGASFDIVLGGSGDGDRRHAVWLPRPARLCGEHRDLVDPKSRRRGDIRDGKPGAAGSRRGRRGLRRGLRRGGAGFGGAGAGVKGVTGPDGSRCGARAGPAAATIVEASASVLST